MAKNEKRWNLRIAIFNDSGELVADTHPDLHPDAPIDGSESCDGMSVAMERISLLLHGYHGANHDSMEGARVRDLVKRVPTIRVYMSQHQGRCSFKVQYTPEGSTQWRARVTIQRENWEGWEPEKDAERAARPSLRVAV